MDLEQKAIKKLQIWRNILEMASLQLKLIALIRFVQPIKQTLQKRMRNLLTVGLVKLYKNFYSRPLKILVEKLSVKILKEA